MSTAVPGAAAPAEVVFRSEHGRIIASLIRLCGSFDRAEEAMQGFRCSAAPLARTRSSNKSRSLDNDYRVPQADRWTETGTYPT